MRVSWPPVLLLLLGCRFEHGQLVDRAVADGSIADPDGPLADARVDAPPGSVCFGIGLFVDCYQPGLVPTGMYAPTGELDTTNPSTCTRVVAQVDGPELCVRTAGTIEIATTVRFTGSRPIVLVASDTIHVTDVGVLDVASRRNDIGAGGNTGTCAAAGGGGANTNNSANAGAGGAGGGGFGTPGGIGGAGQDIGGGDAGGTTALLQVRGGCRGGRGGTSSFGPGGEGGSGGGAVYLIAGTSITVDGIVKANGSGGAGGTRKAGGGGGGSGGLIALDAPAVSITGTLCANGGGGGEGGGRMVAGKEGSDPGAYDVRAVGGTGNPEGGDGGSGSVFANTGVAGAAGVNGGGGGGGGAGRIKFFQASASTGKLSPPGN